MIYKYHKIWRDLCGEDSSVWPEDDLNAEVKKVLRRLRNSHPRIPYTIEIECTSYWGNFEREFIAYSLGILDDTQMRIRHSEEELAMFWKEVFNRKPITFKEAYGVDSTNLYELHQEYLLETFQVVDDWEQLIFYQIDWDILHKNGSNVLKVQLTKPLSPYWEKIIIPRMKDFFIKRPYKYLEEDTKLISITLCNNKGEVIREY
jgi:hypothetical protein